MFKTTRTIRKIREGLEDKLADILEGLNNSSSVEKAEKELIIYAMKLVVSNYTDSEVIPDRVYNFVGEEIIKCKKEISKKVQTQLRK